MSAEPRVEGSTIPGSRSDSGADGSVEPILAAGRAAEPVPPSGVPIAPDRPSSSDTAIERVGYIIGVTCVVLGGLVAAVTGPLQLAKGSWSAAYLVLVAGVLQAILARQRSLLGGGRGGGLVALAALGLWPLGNLLVIIGSLATLPWLVTIGGMLLLAALAAALWRTGGASRRVRVWIARLIYAVALVSVPIGLILSQLRAG